MLDALKHSPEYHQKQGDRMRKRASREGCIFGLRDPSRRAKAVETRLKNGTFIPPNSGRGVTGFRRGVQHYCRSTIEANFARVLLSEKVPYRYEPEMFELPNGMRWTPDFYLDAPLGDIVPAGWVELKGWRKADGTLPGKASEKIDAFQKMTGRQVFVLCQDSDLWEKIEQTYAGRIPWEKGRRNLRTHPHLFGNDR